MVRKLVRSSVNAAMSINDCSKEVSLRSADVANSFEKVPAIVGWSVAHSSLPSPPANEELNALFNTFAAFTCLVFAIDLAKAFVYLEASLS